MAEKQAGKPPNIFLAILFAVVLPVGVALGATYLFFPEPEPDEDPIQLSLQLLDARDPFQAVKVLEPGLDERVEDIRYNQAFLAAHFSLPEYIKGRRARHDDDVIARFGGVCDGGTGAFQYGCYYLGIFYTNLGEYEKAFENFDKVRSRDLPYLNYWIGIAHKEFGAQKEALPFFQRELELRIDEQRTIPVLAQTLVELKDWERLGDIIGDDRYGSSVPFSALQTYRLNRGDFGAYLRGHVEFFRDRIQLTAISLVALGIFAYIWLIRWWALDHPLHPVGLGLICLAGALSAQLVFVVHDFSDLLFDLGFRGDIVNDLLYAIFFAGLVEEAVKFLPVLLIARLSGLLKKPIDWMLYAAAAGLGFGIWEGYLYIARSGYGIALARVFVTLPLHIMLTAFIGALMGETEQRGRGRLALFMIGLAGASVVHGIFDFFLLGPFSILSILSFYLIFMMPIFFMRARGGILSLSGQHCENGMMELTRPPLVAFSIMLVAIILMIAWNVPRENLLRAVGMQAFYALGPFCVLFILSLKPSTPAWVPNWYSLDALGGEPEPDETKQVADDSDRTKEG